MLGNITQHWTINRLYDDTSWALTKLYSTKNDIEAFYSITDDIIRLVDKENITFKDLSIQGLNTHHSVNVAILNVKIGKYVNMTNLHDLALGGLLHDVGKLFISRNILNKSGKLTLKEKHTISKHTTFGYEIINNICNNKNVLNIIKNHHTTIKTLPNPVSLKEVRLDENTIYPLICGVADITDAMLSFRSYKRPLTILETQKELNNFGIKDVEKIFRVIL